MSNAASLSVKSAGLSPGFGQLNKNITHVKVGAERRERRMVGRLDGKVAVITGGGSGIGRAIAVRLAADGAQVVLFGRRQAPLDAATAEIGPSATAVAGDVTSMGDLDRLFAEVRARHGALDILVSSAGSTGGGPLSTCTEDAYDTLMDLNVKSVFFTAQKALPLFRAPASMVIVGSTADTITLPGASVYMASKAALRAFVRGWANDLAPSGVRVNLLSPGITETPLLERLQSTPEAMERFDAMIAARTPMGRRGRPEEIAAVAAFLASEESSYMTGGVIYADGGSANW